MTTCRNVVVKVSSEMCKLCGLYRLEYIAQLKIMGDHQWFLPEEGPLCSLAVTEFSLCAFIRLVVQLYYCYYSCFLLTCFSGCFSLLIFVRRRNRLVRSSSNFACFSLHNAFKSDTSLCSASYVNCQRDTARICCWAPCCGPVLRRRGAERLVIAAASTALSSKPDACRGWGRMAGKKKTNKLEIAE